MVKVLWTSISVKRTNCYFIVVSLSIFTYSGTNGDNRNVRQNNETKSTSIDQHEKSPTDTKTISPGLINLAGVMLYKTKYHSQSKKKLRETAERISLTGKKYISKTYAHTKARFNTFIESPVISNPSFKSLGYQEDHKLNSPQNEESQGFQQLSPFPILTTNFMLSSVPIRQAVGKPCDKKIGRRDDRVADQSQYVGQKAVTRRTRGTLPAHEFYDPITLSTIHIGDPDPKPNVTLITRTTPTTTRTRSRTTPNEYSFSDDCDYVAFYCMKVYDTAVLCGRTMANTYRTFKNYCEMDFVNCMERYDVWQIAHMGECYELKILNEYIHYPYFDDYFLDQYYIMEL